MGAFISVDCENQVTGINKQKHLNPVDHALNFAQRHVRALVERDSDFNPLYRDRGRWRHAKLAWTRWCDGFLPGMMWIFYEETNDQGWRELAVRYSKALEHRK